MTRTLILAGAIWATLGLVPTSFAQTEPPAAGVAAVQPPQDIETIEVTGRRSGPRLWRMAREEAEIWVFASPDFLPEGVEWSDKAVLGVLEEAEEMLTPPRAKVGVLDGPRAVTLVLRTALFNRKALRRPKDQSLADVVGADTAERFYAALHAAETAVEAGEATRQGRDPKPVEDAAGEDRLRTFFLAPRLINAALEGAGLSNREDDVLDRLEKAAKKADVKRTPIKQFPLEVSDGKRFLRGVAAMTPEEERLCLEDAIAFANLDLSGLRRRAEAWARGDVVALSLSPAPQSLDRCEAR
ncbi:MAG: TraB/GumN family protein [Maricaulaceae bacterium]